MKENKSKDPLRSLEISNLKFELNPHTFKNVLQQIQSLSLSTNRAIENLMQILNYMLYDTDKEQVKLQQEIDFMVSYKKMQQSIVPGFVDIIFTNNISDGFIEKKAIAPLLTVAFLENAFKHADTASKNCVIKISLQDTDADTLVYTIENTLDNTNGIQKPASGIGFKNLRRRLDLIYTDQYQIQSERKDDLYCAILTIKLQDYED
jgi:LytS/YehU family sensor histidine kinase